MASPLSPFPRVPCPLWWPPGQGSHRRQGAVCELSEPHPPGRVCLRDKCPAGSEDESLFLRNTATPGRGRAPGSTQRLVGGLGPGPACASRRLRVWAAAFGGCSCRGVGVSGAARAGLSAPARAAPAGLARGPRWAGGASLNEDVPGDTPAPSPPPFLQGGPGRHSARAARGMCLSCAAAGQALRVTRPVHTGPRRPQDGPTEGGPSAHSPATPGRAFRRVPPGAGA